MRIVEHVARILLALVFVIFGSNGFLSFLPAELPPGPAGQFLGILIRSHYVLFVCAVMVIGGLLLLANRFVALGLALLGPVLVNILVFHVTLQPAMIGLPVFLALLWFFLFWRSWSAFSSLFKAKLLQSNDNLKADSLKTSRTKGVEG